MQGSSYASLALVLALLAAVCVAVPIEDELAPHIYVENEEDAIAAAAYFRERRAPKCSSDDECTAQEFCSCGSCKALPKKEGAKCHSKGKRCLSKTCGAGMTCTKKKCKAAVQAAECSKNSDCDSGNFCDCKGTCKALPRLGDKCHPKGKKCHSKTCAAGLMCIKKKCTQDTDAVSTVTPDSAMEATSTTSQGDQPLIVCKKDEVSNGNGGCIKYRWVTKKSAPRPVGEVGNGVVGDVLYMTGAQTKMDNRELTQAYHIPSNTWLPPYALAQRPFDGDHAASETYNGKIYQIGGLCWGNGNCGAEQKVQIYDPVSDTWSLGAKVPYRTNGAQYSTIIGDIIYVCGGLDKVSKAASKDCAAYDIEDDSWSSIPSMPYPGHHGAGCTDGSRFWLFSGRMIKTKIAGSNIVQVYDPRTKSWSTSQKGGLIAPLPRVRSGYGQCVFLGGEFYILGGEEKGKSDWDINKVFDIVDIYNPMTNTWRYGEPMPVAMHGLYPVLYKDKIIVAGGSPKLGPSITDVVQIYEPVASS